jgi:hypothetical protein
MTKKIFLFSMIMVLCLSWQTIAFAQEEGEATTVIEAEIIEEIEEEQTVEPEDLEVEEPKLLPNSPWYFVKDWWRDTKLFFTFNSVKKAEMRQRIADEKLLELRKMAEKGVETEILERARNRYEIQQQKLQTAIEKFKEREMEKPEQLETFKDKFTRHQILHNKLHEEILQKLEGQVPQQAFEKIEEMRETHLQRFGETMLKLEDADKIPERLESAFQNIKGSELKDFKHLEFLKQVKERVQEENQKEIFQQTEERMTERFREKIEQLAPERQERIKIYVEHLPGNKEKQLEIMEQIEEQFQNQEEIRQRIEKGTDKLRQRVKEMKNE